MRPFAFFDSVRRRYFAEIARRWAQTHLERRRYDAAHRALDRALTLEPGRPETLLARGIVRLKAHEVDAALDDLNRALRLCDDHRRAAEVYTWLGLAHVAAGRLNEAIAAYNLALHSDPTHSMAYVYRGLLAVQGGNLAAAISDFNAAVLAEPDNFIAYRHRAEAHVALGQPVAALSDYRQYLRLGSDTAQHCADVHRAIAYLQRQLDAA